MLKSYLKIAVRSLWKEKIYSFINIFGLAIGIACCILIGANVLQELSFDRFHDNANQIFRLVLSEKEPDGSLTRNTLLPASLARSLEAEFGSLIYASGFIVTRPRIVFEENSHYGQMAEVDPSFLTMFTFPLLAGNSTTALSEPNNIVLTESFARRVLGVRDGNYSAVLGKVLRLAGEEDYQVTGVLQDIPPTSSLVFDYLVPLGDRAKFGGDSNWAGYATVYIQLQSQEDAEKMVALLPSFIERHLGNKFTQDESLVSLGNINEVINPQLQPLTDIFLDDNVLSHYNRTGDAVSLYVASAIALLILALACFNFVTLTIGRSSSRATEVGIRKVLGAHRNQVARQFWGETIILSLISLLFGLLFAEIFRPTFNSLVNKHLAASYFDDWGMLLTLCLLVVVTGIIAGAYPAMVLSRFRPVAVFKSKRADGGSSRITRGLVILQNALCIALIIMTAVMSQQLVYFQTKDLGFDKEQVVIVSTGGEKNCERYKQALAQLERVIHAGGSDRSFTSGWQTSAVKDEEGNWVSLRLIRIDPDYLEALRIPLISGRNFSYDRTVDTRESVIVNETLVKTFGWKDPIGRRLPDLKTTDEQGAPAIIGVVKDFHIDRLHKELEPLVLHMNPDRHGIYSLFVRIRPGDIQETIELLRKTWEETIPDAPFGYSFLDEDLNRQYTDEIGWRKIMTYASIFTIIISSMGLLGLALLAAAKRTKEIGIRKVLGASISTIIGLLSKEFMKLMLYANLIAWPIAYLATQMWLRSFAYRIELSAWVFLLSGALALAIALFTISFRSIKAAMANPVDSLRYE